MSVDSPRRHAAERRRTVYRAIALFGISMTAACASTGHAPRPFPVPEGPRARGEREVLPPEPEPHRDPRGGIGTPIAETALALQGSPYRSGGSDPSGFDCSGFTQYVFARYGVALPRETRSQYLAGEPIDRRDLVSGDLVFFSTIAPGASHVAIALDAERFVHAPSSNGVVRVERMSLPYWAARYVGARRIGASSVKTR